MLFESKDVMTKVKLNSFVISDLFDPLPNLDSKIGNIYYIPPEQLKELYDFKSDICSCGVLLYTWLCGHPPFDGQNNRQIIAKIEKGIIYTKCKECESLSIEVRDLITKMLQLYVTTRCSATEALAHKWVKNLSK